jgi:hypothetical protein
MTGGQRRPSARLRVFYMSHIAVKFWSMTATINVLELTLSIPILTDWRGETEKN